MTRRESQKGPPLVAVDRNEVERLLKAAEELLPRDLFELLKGLWNTLQELMKRVQERGTTIARLRRLFGLTSSEKLAEVLGETEPPNPTPEAAAQPGGTGAAAEETSPGVLAGTGEDGAGSKPADDAEPERKKKKVKGHGRVPSSAYLAATHIAVPHASLHPGDSCPDCEHGKVHPLKEPAPILRIVGQAPLCATCWDCERLRCGTCGKVYTARAPEQAQGEKYDETAGSMIALLRYGTGMPFNRLDHLQRDLKTPVPSSTQWDVVSERVELVRPAYDELVRLAAQGSVVHNDDSFMRVLQFMGKRRAALLKKGQLPDPERTGLYTTAIVSIAPTRPAIALFFTGRKHAGENLADVLDKRDADRGPPIQMGDALTRNLPERHEVIASNCLAHGRRKIVDEIANYPVECRYLLERLSRVYEVDEHCRTEKLSDQERLSKHQSESAPVMAEIRQWMEEQFDKKHIEPNSGLGQAFHYLLKRWDNFTLFLRQPGAPLDNNICERALKMAIQNRKGSMFYRSPRGAQVGDVYMTLIHTAELHGENPFDYLTALQRYAKAVAEKPADWLPWTYRDTLARMGVNEALRPSSRPVATPPNAPPRFSRSDDRRDRPPLRRGLCRVRVASRQQHLKLVSEQLSPWLSLRARPVAEPPLR